MFFHKQKDGKRDDKLRDFMGDKVIARLDFSVDKPLYGGTPTVQTRAKAFMGREKYCTFQTISLQMPVRFKLFPWNLYKNLIKSWLPKSIKLETFKLMF